MSSQQHLCLRLHRCVKYDPLTPASAILRELPQSVLDGVLTLFAAYGITVPSISLQTRIAEGGTKSPQESISLHMCERLPMCGVVPWCHVLDPALVGLGHSSNPNTMLTQAGRLVATRAIVAGEHLNTDFGGFMRMHFHDAEEKPFDGGDSTTVDAVFTAAVLDSLAIAIHAAAHVSLTTVEEDRRSGRRQASGSVLPSEWVATRLEELMAKLQRNGAAGRKQYHWGFYAARAALARMRFATRNATKD